MWALIASLSFATSNTIKGVFSNTYTYKAIYMDFYPLIIIYLIFHIKKWKDNKDLSIKQNSPYYVKSDSGELKLDFERMLVPLFRGLIMTFI